MRPGAKTRHGAASGCDDAMCSSKRAVAKASDHGVDAQGIDRAHRAGHRIDARGVTSD
jgi:hypothetical protein